jgi:hypothetical protein
LENTFRDRPTKEANGTMRTRALVIVAVMFLGLVNAPASSAQDKVVVPTKPGKTVTVEWEGTVLPGVNADSECDQPTDAGQDVHELDLVVPANAYRRVSVLATVSITYDGQPDMILTVVFPNEKTDSSDSGGFDADEAVTLSNPAAGTYRVLTCMFAGAAPQDYTGRLTLKAAKPAPLPPPRCAIPPKPLKFTEPSYVDMHRAGGEPSIEIHPDGTYMYGAHAGTTHFYSPNANDPTSSAFVENYRGQVYYWVSDDRGQTWDFVDRSEPPSGIPNSGFSDPDFAIDGAGNVYVSEINLANVAMSKSEDAGHSYQLQNVAAMTVTDRQWTAAGPENVVYMVGNASSGGTFPTDPVGNDGHLIYRSTDGGVTFSSAVQDDGGLGDMKFDLRSGTLYEPHFEEGVLQIAAFPNALDDDVEKALTPKVYKVAEGASLLSHWPAIDVDSRGHVYMVWDESGQGSRAAGIWYSHSGNRGRTWSIPVRVDQDARTDIWPWIAVGRPGRVAIGWFGNNSSLPDQNAELANEEQGWSLYIAQSLTGTGCKGSTTAGFRITQATNAPFHVGTVCQGGTICQAQVVDRRLGDYFTIDVDKQGAVVAGYSDTRQGGSVALPAFLRQTGGPRF